MSSTTSGMADTEARAGFKGATIGALGGTFAGMGITAVANAAAGITPTIGTSIADPFTATLVLLGTALGYLEATA